MGLKIKLQTFYNSHFSKLICCFGFLSVFLFSFTSQKLFAQNTFYWDDIKTITDKTANSSFPKTLTFNDESYLFWQEVDKQEKKIYLNLRKYKDLNTPQETKHFAGPFSYSGDVPDLYTVAINRRGKIVVAANDSLSGISVYVSSDKGESFQRTQITTGSKNMAPRVYADSTGGFTLFTSASEKTAFRLNYTHSRDGIKWSELELFAPSENMTNPFVPYLLTYRGVDYVVFQSQYMGNSDSFTYQLYLTTRDSTSEFWTEPPKLITNNFSFKRKTGRDFSEYPSQVPVLYEYKGDIYLAWERTENGTTKVCLARINKEGIIEGSADEMQNRGSRINFFTYDKELYMTWFNGNNAYYAKKTGNSWKEYTLPAANGKKMFSYPLVVYDSKVNKPVLNFVFQTTEDNSLSSLSILGPDRTVLKPSLKALSFTSGKKYRTKDVQIRVDYPSDTSGIKAYSYVWSQDKDAVPDFVANGKISENILRLKADQEDGDYYLSVRVQDKADNWSEPVSISFCRDLTPPQPPVLEFNNLDRFGLVKSNSYRMNWLPCTEDDVAGYTYRIDYIGEIPKNLKANSYHPLQLNKAQVNGIVSELEKKYSKAINSKRKLSSTPDTTGTQTLSYYNAPNGLYTLTVAAIDKVGNISEPSVRAFVLNKYEPHTLVSETNFQKSKDELGQQEFTIHGSNFTYEGTISEIYIDLDGEAPWDLVLTAENGDFKVVNDTLITNIKIGSSLNEGTYRVVLNHTDRGLTVTKPFLPIDQNGTIKIITPYTPEKHVNENFRRYKYKLSFFIIILCLVILLGVLSLTFIFTTLNRTLYDNILLKYELKSLMKGAPMPGQNRKDNYERRQSLRTKLMAFTLLLIIAVVVGVSVITGYRNIVQQQQTLSSTLLSRTQLLMDTLHTSVYNFIQKDDSNAERELNRLPNQKSALEEANYITILGQPVNVAFDETETDLTYFISSNDPEILKKVNTPELNYRVSQVTDPVLLEITEKLKELDATIQADQDVINLSEKIANPPEREDFSSDEEWENYSEEYDKRMRDSLDLILSQYSQNNSSQVPEFTAENISVNTSTYNYLFYRPVIYYAGNTKTYVHGIVIMEITVENLIKKIQQEFINILIRSIIVALIAVILGAVGAFIFSSMIVRPIKQLEKHVIKIGQTRRKKDIKDINIKTRDEIGRLGDAINKMTEELKNNETEQNLLIDGADVQNSLTPLTKEQTYADFEDDFIIASGYYQAQTGVSGDYFDYHKLDDTWYSFIKSDASGHGAPAAIIATGVAVIYREYFDKWSYKKDGTNINVVVERINDFINNWQLRGKFSTLLVGIYNCKTGEVYMCNAGDNLVHIYEQKTGAIKTLKLKETPTAGPFETFMVNMKGGFIVEKTHLEKGDVLFLYTDGIEESKRLLRTKDFVVQQAEEKAMEKNPKTGRPEEVIKKIDKDEDFGPERVQKIIETFFHKQKYVLTKEQNPMGSEILEFDFSKCEADLHGVIFALASCEKVFRMYKPSNVEETEYITVDKNIDQFLEKCFNRYELYAAKKEKAPDKENFFDYLAVKEDEQGDDLTLLAIQRK